MFEWVKEVFIALGGGTAALLLVLTLFKRFFVKFLESGIEVSLEKILNDSKINLSDLHGLMKFS